MCESYVRSSPARALEFLHYMEDHNQFQVLFQEPIQHLFAQLCEAQDLVLLDEFLLLARRQSVDYLDLTVLG